MAAPMASVLNRVASFSALFRQPSLLSPFMPTVASTRSYWTDWRMIRDVKRRKCLKEFAVQRLRINSLRKNKILPQDLQSVADKEIAALPRDSSIVRIRGRCVITSRPRGVLPRWRLSRFIFRHLSDYNFMCGVQRGRW